MAGERALYGFCFFFSGIVRIPFCRINNTFCSCICIILMHSQRVQRHEESAHNVHLIKGGRTLTTHNQKKYHLHFSLYL